MDVKVKDRFQSQELRDSKTDCDDMGMCCEKKTMTGWRNVWSIKWRVPDQEVDERGPGERWCKKTVKGGGCYGS